MLLFLQRYRHHLHSIRGGQTGFEPASVQAFDDGSLSYSTGSKEQQFEASDHRFASFEELNYPANDFCIAVVAWCIDGEGQV